MSGSTSHYGYTTLTGGESFAANGYAFTNTDREAMDYRDYMGAEAHHHNGDGPAVANPDQAAGLVLTTGGYLPAGATVRYKYTWVDQDGAETAGAPEASISTPAPLSAPGAPTLSAPAGSSISGNYFYVVSAYATVNTAETAVGQRAYITASAPSTQAPITVTFPSLPNGADGFNIYRRSPGATQYLLLASVATNVATPPTYYLDDGSQTPDCNRTAPYYNTTGMTSAVVVTLPVAVPSNCTWKLYRTITVGDYTNSLVHWVVEDTVTQGVIDTAYTDLGSSTLAGSPPAVSQLVGSPSQIDLASEVQGVLPLANVDPIPVILASINLPGTVYVGSCPFSFPVDFHSHFIGVSARLAEDSAPASQPVQIEVNATVPAATPAPVAVQSCEIGVGESASGYTPVSDGGQDYFDLPSGSYLTLDITQDGGGATPTDHDLTIVVYGLQIADQ